MKSEDVSEVNEEKILSMGVFTAMHPLFVEVRWPNG